MEEKPGDYNNPVCTFRHANQNSVGFSQKPIFNVTEDFLKTIDILQGLILGFVILSKHRALYIAA